MNLGYEHSAPVRALRPSTLRNRFGWRYAPFILAALATGLVIYGYMFLAGGWWYMLTGAATVALIWGLAWVAHVSRHAYQRIERSRQELEGTLLGVFGAIITIDMQGIVQLFNPMAERIFGYSAAEVVGRNVSMLMPEPDRSAHDGYLEAYHRTGQAKIIGKGRNVYGRRKDGSVFPAELGVSEAHINGRPMYIGLIHDATARLAAEHEALRRTVELERSNRELDEFAYVASHDLKEPLRGIHNYASFLLEDYSERLDADGRDKLKTLIVLSQRLESLINALLYYSRVGRNSMTVHEVDLNAVVCDVLLTLRPVIEERKVDIRLPTLLPWTVCDGVMVGEVFRNLIVNAMKYSDAETPWVEIGHEERDGQTLFYVRDNGIGIPEKHQQKIFGIFKRLNNRKAYGDGTGLGLTIAQKIVVRHGGRIWVESTSGEGATFYFTLPQEEDSR